MKKIVFEECPYCNSKALFYGYQHDSANIYVDIRGGVFGSPVQHIICKECGSIIYSCAVRPEVFKEPVTEEAKAALEKLEEEKPVVKKEGILEIIVDD